MASTATRRRRPMVFRPTPFAPDTWITFDSVFAAECLVRTGFDWTVIDT